MYLINKRNVSIFSFLFVLNCCATIPPEVGGKWRAAFDGVINYYQGYPDYPITAQMIDEIPYASLRMKIGCCPPYIGYSTCLRPYGATCRLRSH